MGEFWYSLNFIGRIYTIMSIGGGLLFLVQLMLRIVWGDSEGDYSLPNSESDHPNSDIGFKILSLQGLSSFSLMAGLTGLSAIKAGASLPTSVLFALIAGLGSVLIIRAVFKLAISLQSVGTTKLSSAIGQEGKVYLPIPRNGVGKIEVMVGGRTMIVDAIQIGDDEADLAMGERVIVVGISKKNIFEVVAIR